MAIQIQDKSLIVGGQRHAAWTVVLNLDVDREDQAIQGGGAVRLAPIVSVTAAGVTYAALLPGGQVPIAYAWLRNSTEIAGATGSSYTTVAADIGATLTPLARVAAFVASTAGVQAPVVSASTATRLLLGSDQILFDSNYWVLA